MFTYFRMLVGIFLTHKLHFQQCSFHKREGILVEKAQLITGDYLLRVLHPPNAFCSCSDFEYAMGYDIYANKIVWFPKQHVEIQKDHDKPVFFYDYLNSKCFYEDRALDPWCCKVVESKPKTSDTPPELVAVYNNPEFMNSLYTRFFSDSNRRTSINKAISLECSK